MHRYLLAPTTDVPIGRREYAVRLSTNKRGSYSTPPPSDSSYGCAYWTAGIRPLLSQPIGEDLTYFSIGELPISYGCAYWTPGIRPLLSTNRRGPYIFLLEGYQSATDVPFGQRENILNQYEWTLRINWTSGIRPLLSQPIGEDLTYFSIKGRPIRWAFL